VKHLTRLPGLLLRVSLVGLFLSVPTYLLLQNFAVVEPVLYPLHLLQAKPSPVSPELLLGPYPDHAELSRLKSKGYGAVVSLLSSDFIYERSLLKQEQANAHSLGIAFYNYPMNSSQPRTSQLNARAIKAIDQLLNQHPGQQFYIHCYLGKHRTAMVSQWLIDRHGDQLIAAAAR
jgi:protein tyrosine/serine phosphatase